MYVCICVGLTERRIQSALDQGQSLEQIQEETGAGTHCGKCIRELQCMARSAQNHDKTLVPAH